MKLLLVYLLLQMKKWWQLYLIKDMVKKFLLKNLLYKIVAEKE